MIVKSVVTNGYDDKKEAKDTKNRNSTFLWQRTRFKTN